VQVGGADGDEGEEVLDVVLGYEAGLLGCWLFLSRWVVRSDLRVFRVVD